MEETTCTHITEQTLICWEDTEITCVNGPMHVRRNEQDATSTGMIASFTTNAKSKSNLSNNLVHQQWPLQIALLVSPWHDICIHVCSMFYINQLKTLLTTSVLRYVSMSMSVLLRPNIHFTAMKTDGSQQVHKY